MFPVLPSQSTQSSALSGCGPPTWWPAFPAEPGEMGGGMNTKGSPPLGVFQKSLLPLPISGKWDFSKCTALTFPNTSLQAHCYATRIAGLCRIY